MSFRAILAAILIALFASAGFALAQASAINGTIEGVIQDSSGSAIPGVAIAVINTGTGLSRVVTTNAIVFD